MKVVCLERNVARDELFVASNTRNHGPSEFDSDDCLVLRRILTASLETCAVHKRHAIYRMIDLLEVT